VAAGLAESSISEILEKLKMSQIESLPISFFTHFCYIFVFYVVVKAPKVIFY
jgi:hypothetical protein